MSWEIKQEGSVSLIVLSDEMRIQDAASFYQAVLPLAGMGRAVRVDAAAATAIHTSIMQILHALARAVPDFGMTGTAGGFLGAESRMGFSLPRSMDNCAPLHSEPALLQ